MKMLILPVLLALSACGSLPGPSVPAQAGQNLQSARQAVTACAPNAPQGGRTAVVGSYLGGVLLGGLVVGPIIVASNEGTIRANGEANAVDNCLAKSGFKRRNLTAQEVQALNGMTPSERLVFLDHLISGGTVATFGAPQS